jgi:hypothetical protein
LDLSSLAWLRSIWWLGSGSACGLAQSSGLVLVRLVTVHSAPVSQLDFSWLTAVCWCASFSRQRFLVRGSKKKRATVFLSCTILLSLLQENNWVPEAKKKKRKKEGYCSYLLLAVLGDSSLSLFIATQRTVGS